MTVLDLIKASLRVLGILAAGETPDAQQSTDARQALNLMLGEWDNDGFLTLREQQNFSVSSGTASYSIGDGETWDGNKPLKILVAYLRDSDGYDHPLTIINEKEYMEIYDKDSEGRPTRLFYQPAETTGTVYLYPEPDDAYTIYLLNHKEFTEYTALTTTISLPSGYLNALKFNLAVEIAPEYEREPSQWVISQATKKLAAIKSTNVKKPGPMKFDNALTGQPGIYDIDSDSYL